MTELWVAYDTGKDFCNNAINSLVTVLGSTIYNAMPMVNTFTGCDTVSSFFGQGKVTAFKILKLYPPVIEALNELSSS